MYIEVEDIDAKLKEIKKARGKVLVKKTEIGGDGMVGPVRDPRRVLPLALAGRQGDGQQADDDPGTGDRD